MLDKRRHPDILAHFEARDSAPTKVYLDSRHDKAAAATLHLPAGMKVVPGAMELAHLKELASDASIPRRYLKVGPGDYVPVDSLTVFNISSIANYCLGGWLDRTWSQARKSVGRKGGRKGFLVPGLLTRLRTYSQRYKL